MGNDWVNDDTFKSREGYLAQQLNDLAETLGVKAHRVPIHIIVQLGDLDHETVAEPPDCIDFDPQKKFSDPAPCLVDALVAQATIPPLPYPENLGGIIKEEIQRWVFTSQPFNASQGVNAFGPATPLTELSLDDPLLLKAKELIIDNAKQEIVSFVDADGNLRFGTLVNRDISCPNFWKEQYALEELSLPILLKARARQPQNLSPVTIETNPGKEDNEIILCAGLLGSESICWEREPGSGPAPGTEPPVVTTACPPVHGLCDLESHCRCYAIQAIIRPACCTELRATQTGEFSFGVSPYTGIRNCNFFFAKLPPEFGSKIVAVLSSAPYVVGDPACDGAEPPADPCGTPLPTEQNPEPHDPELIGSCYPTLCSGTVLNVCKIDVLVVDVWVNDNFVSHIFCPPSDIQITPGQVKCIPKKFVQVAQVGFPVGQEC